MAVPTLTKSWYFDVNQSVPAQASALATYRKLVFNIKNTLVTRGLWSVRRSSNSSTVSNSDLWLAESDLTWSATNRSWIVLRNTSIASACDILIDLSGGTGFTYVKVAPNGFNLDGAINSAPTSIGGAPIIETGSPAFYYGNSNYASYLHMMQSQDGYCTRIIVRGSGVSSSTNYSALMIERLSSSLNSNYLYSPVSLLHLPYDSNSMTSRIILTNPNSSASQSTQVSLLKATSELGSSFAAAGKYTNEYMISNLGLMYYTYPNRGKIGTFSDLWFKEAVQNPSTGEYYFISVPGDGTKSFLQFQNCMVPWNGTVCLSP